MHELTSVEIKCLRCGQWSRSGFAFRSLEDFENTGMRGNLQQCFHCGAMTPANKENMRLRGPSGGHVGNQT